MLGSTAQQKSRMAFEVGCYVEFVDRMMALASHSFSKGKTKVMEGVRKPDYCYMRTT